MQIKARDVRPGDKIEYLGCALVVDDIGFSGEDLYFTGKRGRPITVHPDMYVTRTRVIRERRLRKP